MSYTVYILQSQLDGSFYVGQTAALSARLTCHNRGEVRSTKSKRPWTLIHCEEFQTRSEAIAREEQIKPRKKRSFIEGLIGG